MLRCCATKKAATAVSIVKSTFQVFNTYIFGDTVTKEFYIIGAIMSVLFKPRSETMRLSPGWFIMYQFIKMHTVLRFIKGIIAYSDFCLANSVFSSCHLHFRNSGTHSDLELIRFGFVHSNPGPHLNKY